MQTTPIILADAQYLTRLGLRYLLSQRDSFRIVAEASDEEELLELLDTSPGSLIILDYNQPDSFSYETILHIRAKSPNSNILIISGDNDKSNIYQVLEHGVNSFLTKACDEEEIFDAVEATAKGERFFCGKVLDMIMERSFGKPGQECAPTPLTPREIEIVRLTARGLIAKEIADVLSLSPHTIYTHRKNIMKKLKLNSSSELVLYAVNNGMID